MDDGKEQGNHAEELEQTLDIKGPVSLEGVDFSKAYEDCLLDLKRERANFINYKARVEREKTDQAKYANQQIVEEFLDIRDNLERALDSSSGDSALSSGVKLTLKQLDNLLKKHGVVEIDVSEGVFDPNIHEAMLVEEADVEKEMVAEVLQRGYMLYERVVRPAKVKIIKPKED